MSTGVCEGSAASTVVRVPTVLLPIVRQLVESHRELTRAKRQLEDLQSKISP